MVANDKKPVVLIINCHGDLNKNTKETTFCFEKKEVPSLVNNVGKESLIALLRKDSQG